MKSNLTPTRYSTRTGKIARLPQVIRQQLNERLADGESHQHLVAWLNSHGHVQHRLIEFFDGRPITEQNLSDWRQGGFLDWQRHQESRGLVREFLSETEELEEEMGESALLDRLTGSVTVVLLRLFREVSTAESGPEQRQAVLEIARELARLRRGDHQRQRTRIMEEQFRLHRPPPLVMAQIESDEGMKKFWEEERKYTLRREGFRAEYITGLENGTLTPERQEWIEQYFDYMDEVLEGYSDDPEEPDDEEAEKTEPVVKPVKAARRRKKAQRRKARKAPAHKKETAGTEKQSKIKTAPETGLETEAQNTSTAAPGPAFPESSAPTPPTETPAATATPPEPSVQSDRA